jgi:hypothetical protein
MKVGELFVDFKIRGSDDSVKQTRQVRSSMSSLKDMAIETKAAILAAVIALEKLLKAPMETGSSLYVVSQYTGETVENIQKIQAALSGVEPGKVLGFYQQIFDKLSEFQTSVGPIMGEGLAGSFLVPKEEDFRTATAFVDYLRKVVQSPEMTKAQAAMLGKQLGVDPEVLVALREQALKNRSILDFSPVAGISQGKAKQMYGIQGQYNQVVEGAKKAMASLTAAIGPSVLQTASNAVTAFSQLATALTDIAKALQILEYSKSTMDGFAQGLSALATAAKDITKVFGGKMSFGDAFKELLKVAPSIYKMTPSGLILNPLQKMFEMVPHKTTEEEEKLRKNLLIPGAHGQNTINQTIHIDGSVEDSAERIAQVISEKTKQAYYQFSSRAQIA